jgi:D-alanyl-D-alanine carboxypeptidase (penicillin-binding protein 5/6)
VIQRLIIYCALLLPAVANSLFADVLELNARAAVMIDASTGTLLYTKNPDEKIPPASLTKLVTTHIALSEAKRRGIGLNTIMSLPPASWARNQPPRSSLMWLDEGQVVTLRELLLGLAVSSGNDAAAAIALNFAPDIAHFAQMMTAETRKLGLRNTFFVEPSGISEENWTTAREFAEFCREYIKMYPENLTEFHSVAEFDYPKSENMPPSRRNNPRTVKERNHIGLLKTYPGVDGLKTGYIDESGYNLALTAERDGTRLIVVLLGVPAGLGGYWGPRFRDADGAALLDWGYERYKTLRFVYPEFAPVRVWQGKKSYIPVNAHIEGQDPRGSGALTVPKNRGADLGYNIISRAVRAPFPQGTQLGMIIVSDADGELARIPLVAAEPVEKGGIFKRIWDAIMMLFSGIHAASPPSHSQ